MSRIGSASGMSGGMQQITGIDRLGLYGVGTAFQDAFVEGSPPVVLSSHTPNIGVSWTKFQGTGTLNVNPSGVVVSSNTGNNGYFATPGAPSADCYVECQMKYNSFGGGIGYLILRYQDSNNYYYLWWQPLGTTVIMWKRVAGSNTQLGSTYTLGGSVGDTHTFKLTASGSTIKGYVDGVERISATDSAISAAGLSGIRYDGGGTDNIAFLAT